MHAKQIEKFSKFRVHTSLLLLLVLITGSLGRLTEAPKNNFVLKGATAEFTCCSDVQEPFFWKVKSFGSQYIKYIYDVGLVNGFRQTGRFNVTEGSSSGCYRLTITVVKLEDAGTYFCVDKQGLGQQLGWELVILESFDCQEKNRKAEYMGDNNFGLPQDVISTMCISKYFGNIPPKPICEWSSGTKLLDNYQHVTEINLTTVLNIQMPARKEFNRDQLSCYVKIDGEASDNQTATAWKSSRLIINYASFHQKGVSECSVDELSLDCHPLCEYKKTRFSNGSFYCEIAYPSQTHKKLFVLLQDINLHQTTVISSTTNIPVTQPQSSVTFPIVTAVVVTLLISCALAATTAAAIIIIRRKRRQRRNRDMPVMIELDPNHSRGHHTLSKPGIVINMGDGNNVTVNTVYGDQRSSVTMKQENKPLLEEVDTKKLSRQSSTPNSEPENVAIRGVAVLGDDLFFAYRNSSHVRVYSANTLDYKLSWELTELKKLVDMTACSKHNCLYISNTKVTAKEGEIFQVSPQGKLIKKWETGRNYNGRLSVTHDLNVLLAVHVNRKLVEYMPDGTHLREIQLPDSLRPIYALKVNSDYYVSHGFGEDPVHGVSQVDANGKVLKQFGQGKGSTTEQLDTPVHLAMNDGSIWVADSQNGRVVVLSASLKYQSTLLSKEDDLSCPLRICLDQANRRLLLSDFQNKNHFLRVFNFK